MKRVFVVLVVGLMSAAYVGCNQEDAGKKADTASAKKVSGDVVPAETLAEMTTVNLKVPNMT